MYNRRAPTTVAPTSSSTLHFWLARAHTVCLFISFSLPIALHLFPSLSLFLSPMQTHALSMTTNDNGIRIYIYTYVSSPFSGRFSSLLPSSSSSFSYHLVKYIYVQYIPMKEKNRLCVGNSFV